MTENNKPKTPCDRCGSSRWIRWADGQNYTCQQCGSFYLKKPIKVIGKVEKLGELKDGRS